ncbi:MAG: phage holin family protein [Candidatus Yanofskybacteria bacterium]|nr:phage holin family protein [Candidatus Yanofskybacteria bacterium]
MVRRFIVRIIVSAAALWVADFFLTGVAVTGGIVHGYLLAGLVLGALNTFIRPLLKFLAFPLIIVSLGFFTLIINAGILWFVADALDAVTISGILPLLWATAIVSVVHLLLNPRAS